MPAAQRHTEAGSNHGQGRSGSRRWGMTRGPRECLRPFRRQSHAEWVSIAERLYHGPCSTSVLRSFSVWCAARVWHCVERASEYDLDRRARLRFARSLNVARREARCHATSSEVMAAWVSAVDQRAARTAWWPGRLASRGAFRAAAQMAARFACRATSHVDAGTAALCASYWTGWAVGYLAASERADHALRVMDAKPLGTSSRWMRVVCDAQCLADEARIAEEAEHVREIRRWIA